MGILKMDEVQQNPRLDLLNAWSWRAKRASQAHYDAAKHYNGYHKLLGIMLLCAAVMTVILSSNGVFKITIFEVLMSIFSVATLGLAVSTVFLQYDTRARDHHDIASKYASIKRDIELFLSETESSKDTEDTFLGRIKDRMNRLGDCSPKVPYTIWEDNDRRLSSEKKQFIRE